MATYTYDFGDSRVHTLTLKEIVERYPRSRYPRWVSGERAYPLENFGEAWGYAELPEIIQDHSHEVYLDRL